MNRRSESRPDELIDCNRSLWFCWSDHLLHIFRKNIYFKIHRIAGSERTQVRDFCCVRNDGNLNFGSLDRCYREADAFDGERPLGNDVAGELGRDIDLQQVIIAIWHGFERNYGADRINVALNNVSIEASVRAHWKFKIDECSGFQPGKGSAKPCFLREIGGEGILCDLNHGEANAADGDAVALLELERDFRSGDGQPAPGPIYPDRGDPADFFDDASEHKFKATDLGGLTRIKVFEKNP